MNTKAKTEDYIEEGKDYLEKGKAKLSDAMERVQNRVGETARNVGARAKDVSYATDRYVRDNPWQTIAVVAVAACLLGWFLSKARD